MSRHANLLWAAAESLDRHRLRAVVTVLCLVSAVAPYQAALAVLEGVREESALSVAGGPDLYVAGSAFGREAPVNRDLAAAIASLPGVRRVRPRITGRIYLGAKLVTVVGIDEPGAALAMVAAAAAKPPPAPLQGEALVGAGVARATGLKPGDGLVLEGDRVLSLTVREVFEADSGIHAASLVVMSLDDAGALFGIPGRVSDLLVWVEPGREQEVANGIRPLLPQARVQSRDLVSRYVDRGLTLKGGVFVALDLAALGLAIPAVLVTSGLGLSERRREIGVLKATGWSTDEVLEMALWECLLMALAASGASGVITWLWLRPLNGAVLSQFLIAGSGSEPDFVVPARFLWPSQAVAGLLCLAILVSGAAVTSWRAASVAPREALR
jgi:ABC-type lipoprotein release transport system permease subunit